MSATEFPPPIVSVPLCACTRPLLLNVTAPLTALAVPADLRNVPAFTNVDPAPPEYERSKLPCTSKL